MKSEYLRIRVSERFRTRVEVAFGAGAASNLTDVIPSELREKISEVVDLDCVSREAAVHGFPPGELFSLDCEGRHVSAWLE